MVFLTEHQVDWPDQNLQEGEGKLDSHNTSLSHTVRPACLFHNSMHHDSSVPIIDDSYNYVPIEEAIHSLVFVCKHNYVANYVADEVVLLIWSHLEH